MKKLFLLVGCFFSLSLLAQNSNFFTVSAGGRDYNVYLNDDDSFKELSLAENLLPGSKFTYKVLEIFYKFEDDRQLLSKIVLSTSDVISEVKVFSVGGYGSGSSSLVDKEDKNSYIIYVKYSENSYSQVFSNGKLPGTSNVFDYNAFAGKHY